jgi:hypothetical protein
VTKFIMPNRTTCTASSFGNYVRDVVILLLKNVLFFMLPYLTHYSFWKIAGDLLDDLRTPLLDMANKKLANRKNV